MSERPRLDSWKEIARYLHRDVRTVIRWEQSRRLPVHRLPGGTVSRVFAYPEEIDKWLEGVHPEAATDNATGTADQEKAEAVPRYARLARWPARVALGAVLVVLGLGAWGWTRNDAPPQRLTIAGNELVAVDASGRASWRRTLPDSGIDSSSLRTHIGDLDANGRSEVLVALDVPQQGAKAHAGELLKFTAGGTLQWSTAVDDRLAFRDGEYGPPWASAGLAVYRVGRDTRISWALHHFTWWPGQVVTFAPDGTRIGTFVNSGWIRDVAPSVDGRYLFLTGVSNSRQAYFFAVLDAVNPVGRSPEPVGSPMECVQCPDGDPLLYMVFPRSDVSQQQPFPTSGPTFMTFSDGSTQVHVLESHEPQNAATIYEFGSDLRLRNARVNDAFWTWHRRMEGAGTLPHDAEACPARHGVDVQRWTRADGWTTVRVPVRQN